ncbi:hypothetical protein BJV78DRAFT_1286317 [Lactifluus subvellereus]|nr:hypothetical protein BJV78DRAFT_1286317 [Lactifluus subvellereus]
MGLWRPERLEHSRSSRTSGSRRDEVGAGWHTGVGRGRGRGKGHSPRPDFESSHRAGDTPEVEDDVQLGAADGTEIDPGDEPVLETLEERERFYQELVRAREAERKKAIAEGKMDDPLVPKRLDEAITMVGTCVDMCPRFERYRRERENNLFNWEVIPGTKRVDHKRAVKMYERAAGDKTLPSDLRPPPVLKRTLDYLFRELVAEEGFSPTFDFIRDRSRAVRNDFTMQHETGPLAIECHERCARFHILALHFERDRTGFSVALEEQQLMNTLQSLKEFYEDQRNRYESPNELEMRIYHRLIHIVINANHVQAKSSPITKVSPLVVDEGGMLHFSELATLLRQQGNRVMVYLVACILERLFGKDTIEDIEAIHDGIAIPDIIDGVLSDDGVVAATDAGLRDYDEEEAFLREDEPIVEEPAEPQYEPKPLKPSATEWLTNNFVFGPPPASAFGSSIPAPPSAPSSVVPPAASAFANLKTTPNVFGSQTFGSGSAFGSSSSVFGASSSAFGTTPSAPGASSMTTGPFVLGEHTKSGSSFPPFGASASAPVVSDTGDQRIAASAFESPFSKSTISTSLAPAAGVVESSSSTFSASQSAPSGFPNKVLDTSFGPGTTPPSSSISASAQKPPATALNPQAPAFSPGLSFGAPPSTASVQDEKEPTARPFGPSSSFPTISTSMAATRPILPPINTSPLSSASTSTPPPAKLTTSQSAPHLNGFTKEPSLLDRLQRQPTIVDGFRPPTYGTQPGEGSTASETPDPNAPPQHPPPLKMQPISLPGTPTDTTFSPSLRQKPINNLFDWTSAQSGSKILSPLISQHGRVAVIYRTARTVSGRSRGAAALAKETPRNGKSPASPQDIEMASPTAAPLRNGKSKGKGKAPAVDLEELEARASAFARTSALRRVHGTENEETARNGAATGAEPETKVVERRTRRRVSAKYTPPQTDAELARRLKENHEQHERRWAPGTLLAAARTHVGDPAPFDYCLWLSLNPENDGTAIWVERKFDMPNSGAWVSERVFSIPLAPDVVSRSPGLVVFECSPLHGVNDEIEKKYLVLDDCARLREVIETFPEDRHFIPSALFILWGEDESEPLPDDLRRMADDYETKGIIGSRATFSLSSKTKDLDEKFAQVLGSMDLDTAGGLVEILSRQEFLQLVIAPWKDFALDWVSRCSADGEVDWLLFSKVFEALVKLTNTLSVHFTTRLDEAAVSNPLPEIRLDGVKSSSELYDAAFAWLEHKDLRTSSREFRMLLQSYRTSNADFPVHSFAEALYDLSVRCIEGSVTIDRAVRYPVPKRDIEETKREAENDVAEVATQLRSLFLFHTRPKRPPPDDDDEASVLSMSPSSKRLKSTFSSFSTIEDLAHSGSNELMPPPSSAVSPSTSVTTIANEEKPQQVITVAMLRALTQSVLKNRSRG